MDEKQKAILDRAKKGVLQFVQQKGGKAPLSEMHEYSESKFFIAHQSFSRLMENLVDEGFVEFDRAENIAKLTDKGIQFLGLVRF